MHLHLVWLHVNVTAALALAASSSSSTSSWMSLATWAENPTRSQFCWNPFFPSPKFPPRFSFAYPPATSTCNYFSRLQIARSLSVSLYLSIPEYPRVSASIWVSCAGRVSQTISIFSICSCFLGLGCLFVDFTRCGMTLVAPHHQTLNTGGVRSIDLRNL